MKKIISKIATTTALSALLIAPAVANEFKVSVGGYANAGVASVNSDNTAVESSAIIQEAEIHFKAKTVADNGIEYGFQVQLEAASDSDQVDEHYAYVKGGFGKVTIGAENGAADLGAVQAPKFVGGLKMYGNSFTDAIIEKALPGIDDQHMSTRSEHASGDAMKIIYFTPRVAGFQLGLSHAPNNAAPKGAENNTDKSAATTNDINALSLNYKGSIGDMKLKVGGTYLSGHTIKSGAGYDDPETSSLGVNVSLGAWSFGVNTTDYESLNNKKNNDVETTNMAISYKTGGTTLGIGYTESDGSDDDDPTKKIDYKEYMIGGKTALSEGVALGYYYQDAEKKYKEAGMKAEDVQIFGVNLALKF